MNDGEHHPTPSISIVTATYNRSRALALTIAAIRRQTFDDWELLVIGDACTDDTATVVAAIGDPRIRFHNLTRNTGEQAGPNNTGWQLARAEIVAFCNHDVIWLPNHLQLAHDTLRSECADLVFGTTAIIGGDAPVPLEWPGLPVALDGVPARGSWDPGLLNASTVSASSMVMRRALLERVNGWRLARDCSSEPSQDLLFRAWRSGARIRAVGMLTSVTAPSGFRRGSYVANAAPESEWLVAQLDRPDLAAELLAAALETNDAFDRRHDPRPRLAVQRAARLAARLGIDPRAAWFRYRRKLGPGEYLASLRAIRGLPVRPRHLGPAATIRYDESARRCEVELGRTTSFAAGAGGARHLAAGWSRPDAEGVWADGDHATLLFCVADDATSDLELELRFRVFLGGRAQRPVRLAVGDRELGRLTLAAGVGWDHRFRIGPSDRRAGRFTIELQFGNPESPRSLGLSDDDRRLSVGLVSATVRSSP